MDEELAAQQAAWERLRTSVVATSAIANDAVRRGGASETAPAKTGTAVPGRSSNRRRRRSSSNPTGRATQRRAPATDQTAGGEPVRSTRGRARGRNTAAASQPARPVTAAATRTNPSDAQGPRPATTNPATDRAGASTPTPEEAITTKPATTPAAITAAAQKPRRATIKSNAAAAVFSGAGWAAVVTQTRAGSSTGLTTNVAAGADVPACLAATLNTVVGDRAAGKLRKQMRAHGLITGPTIYQHTATGVTVTLAPVTDAPYDQTALQTLIHNATRNSQPITL